MPNTPLPTEWHGHIKSLPERGNTLFLTFDDGPRYGFHPDEIRDGKSVTQALWEVLDARLARATFFWVGWRIDASVRAHQADPTKPDYLEELKNNHHDLGNHTYHHPPYYEPDPRSIYYGHSLASLGSDPKRGVDLVTDTIFWWDKRVRQLRPGYTPLGYFRAPGGSGMSEMDGSRTRDSPALKQALDRLQYKYLVGWKVLAGDDKQPTPSPDTLYNNMKTQIDNLTKDNPHGADGAIILAHETWNTVEAVRMLLKHYGPTYNFQRISSP